MVGENIKKLRKEKGMTQKNLADALFVTAQAVSRWENGEVEPSITTISQIAKLFNVPLELLINTNEDILETTESLENIENTKLNENQNNNVVLAVCEECNKPIYDANEIVRKNNGKFKVVLCKECNKKNIDMQTNKATKIGVSRRIKSFIVGGILATLIIAMGLYSSIIIQDIYIFLTFFVIAIMSFTFSSCCLLANNFVRDLVSEIFSLGFVKMPGIIFSLSLDGLLWLLTIKLLFWIIGFVLAVLTGILAILVGGIMSVFVYPFAIIKNYKKPYEHDFI